MLDNLIHKQEVAPIIVALINGHDRNPEYGANPRHADFIVKDVLPAVEARYNITPGAENKGLMGASFEALPAYIQHGVIPIRFAGCCYNPDHLRLRISDIMDVQNSGTPLLNSSMNYEKDQT